MPSLEQFGARQKAPVAEKERPPSFPPSPSAIGIERTLGGSSGVTSGSYEGSVYATKRARTSESDPKKNEWYQEQLKEEYVADKVYEAMGFAVPNSRMYESGTVKVSSFVKGKDLNELDKEHRASTSAELKRGFVLDALLANWDVIGLVEDNIRLGEDGRVYRLDNGGSFRFRAQGEPKGTNFGKKVGELESLRAHNKLYADVTDEEIQRQIHDVVQNREKILSTIERAGQETSIAPTSLGELKNVITERISYLEKVLQEKSTKQ